jgi:Tfp pilus assembly protein PilN
MKEIDFLPARYREQQAQRTKQNWRMVVVSCYGLLLLAAVLVQRNRQQAMEAELALAGQQFDAATAQAAQLTELQSRLAADRKQAELLVWLRHPWPKTQILAEVLRSLPETVVLDELEIGREVNPQSAGAGAVVRSIPVPGVGGGTTGEDKRSPAERDLDRLREEIDACLYVVSLAGRTQDTAALHAYLSKLGHSNLVAKVELLSVETLDDAPALGSKFSARAILRPGYGQPGGPLGPTGVRPGPDQTVASFPERSSP